MKVRNFILFMYVFKSKFKLTTAQTNEEKLAVKHKSIRCIRNVIIVVVRGYVVGQQSVLLHVELSNVSSQIIGSNL